MDELKKVIPSLGFDLVGLTEVSYAEGIDPNTNDLCEQGCCQCISGCVICIASCSVCQKLG